MIKEAVEIDKKNGNTLWQDAIQKEMEKVKITLTEGEMMLNGYQYANCHVVFDIKTEYFCKNGMPSGRRPFGGYSTPKSYEG